MIKGLIKGIKEKWNGKKEEQGPGPYWKGFHGIGLFHKRINYDAIRMNRTNRVRMRFSNLNSSQKNRQIRSIKTANHIAKGIHYKDCPDVS